jgi:hypothetical protein
MYWGDEQRTTMARKKVHHEQVSWVHGVEE